MKLNRKMIVAVALLGLGGSSAMAVQVETGVVRSAVVPGIVGAIGASRLKVNTPALNLSGMNLNASKMNLSQLKITPEADSLKQAPIPIQVSAVGVSAATILGNNATIVEAPEVKTQKAITAITDQRLNS